MLFFTAYQHHPWTVRLLRRPEMKLLHLEINCQADGACAAFFVTNWFLILAWKYKKSQPVQIHTSQGLENGPLNIKV